MMREPFAYERPWSPFCDWGHHYFPVIDPVTGGVKKERCAGWKCGKERAVHYGPRKPLLLHVPDSLIRDLIPWRRRG